MVFRRIYQFFIIFGIGLVCLWILKISLNLSDFVIPGPAAVVRVWRMMSARYLRDVWDTLLVAMIGQSMSVVLALTVGIAGRSAGWFGTFVKAAAYNVQAYPIVALAPIIFILVGDGFLARLLIAAMICYFPILLVVLGALAEPIPDVEHFYTTTGRMTRFLEIRIRAFENMGKLATAISGSATMAMAGTIVAEFIAANAGIGYSIRVALYQSDLGKIVTALFFIGLVLAVYQGVLEWCGYRITRPWLPASDHSGSRSSG